MFTPSRLILPSTRAFGVSSCIRFRVRRKVDLPQPDGPMMAVTARGGIVRLMPRTARNDAYQTSRPSMAISPLVPTGAGGAAGFGVGGATGAASCSGASIASSGPRTAVSTFMSSTLADAAAPGPSPDRDVDDEHDEQEQERGAPRLLVQGVDRLPCVDVDEQRE